MSATLKLFWVFTSFEPGRPAQRFATLASGLGAGYEHVVLSMDGRYEAERAMPAGVRWRRFDESGRSPSKPTRGLVSIGNLWAIRKALAAERPHLVVTSNGGALEWLMVNRGSNAAPHIHIEDAAARDEALDLGDRNRAWARRRAFPGRARVFLAPSSEIARALNGDWGAPLEQVRRIEPAAPAELFDLPFAGGDRTRPVTFGATAPLERPRRHDRLLRVLASLRTRGRSVRGLIWGAGSERAGLLDAIQALGLTDVVELLDPAKIGLASVLARVDVLCQTSDADNAGDAIAAGMAAGRPILARPCPDLLERLSAANRPFVGRGDDLGALTAAAELLAVDGALRREIGAANRLTAADRFAEATLTATFERAMRAAMGDAPRLMLPAPDAAEAIVVDRAPIRIETGPEALARARAEAVAAARARASAASAEARLAASAEARPAAQARAVAG